MAFVPNQTPVSGRLAVERESDLPGRPIWGITTNLQQPFVVGEGSIFVLNGWYHSASTRIRAIHVQAGRDKHDGFLTGAHDALTLQQRSEGSDDEDRTHFTVFVPVTENMAPGELLLSIQITLSDGKSITASLGALKLVLRQTTITPLHVVGAYSTPTHPFIAICMATYNPPLALFKRQIQSLCEQTYNNWICIINDDGSLPETYDEMKDIVRKDGRFYLFRNSTNLGFYHNFEQALLHVPTEANFIALCDQDDYWYADKLQVTIDAFTPERTLVYSDMDIVTATGETLYHTLWVGRENNFSDLEKLLFLNSVTGAASMFRASLLAKILPFPAPIAGTYHDHWLGCMAISLGLLGYIDKPLYAYVQHENNVSEQGYANVMTADRANPLALLVRKINTALGRSTNVYFHDTLRALLFGKTLLLRVPTMPHERKRRLQSFLRRKEFVFRRTPTYRE